MTASHMLAQFDYAPSFWAGSTLVPSPNEGATVRHLCAVPLLEPIVRVVLPRTLRHRLKVLAPGRFPTWAISDQQSTRGVQSRS